MNWLKKFKCLFFILIFISCEINSNSNEELLRKGSIYLIIPISDSCNSCVSSTFDFIENHHPLSNGIDLELIITSIYDINHLKFDVTEHILKKCTIDSSNYFVKKGYVNNYPVILEKKDDSIELIELNPRSINNILEALKKGMD